MKRFRAKDIREIVLVSLLSLLLIFAIGGALLFNIIVPPMKEYFLTTDNADYKESDLGTDEVQASESNSTDSENIGSETAETETESVPEDTTQEEKKETDAIHRYEYMIEDCTWSEAFERALSRGGYLVNINSKKEFKYIVKQMKEKGLKEMIFFIGANREDEENYYWVNRDGEQYGDCLNKDSDAWYYQRWMQGEPSYNDREFREDVMVMFFFKSENRWVFNDVPDNILNAASYYSGKIGYIVEYD